MLTSRTEISDGMISRISPTNRCVGVIRRIISPMSPEGCARVPMRVTRISGRVFVTFRMCRSVCPFDSMAMPYAPLAGSPIASEKAGWFPVHSSPKGVSLSGPKFSSPPAGSVTVADHGASHVGRPSSRTANVSTAVSPGAYEARSRLNAKAPQVKSRSSRSVSSSRSPLRESACRRRRFSPCWPLNAARTCHVPGVNVRSGSSVTR